MKKVLLILVPLLLLGGGTTVGLAMLGIVNVPFLPFGKKRTPPPVDDGKGGPMARTFLQIAAAGVGLENAVAAAKKAVPPAPPAPPPDTGPGEAKLAGLWAEMPTPQLAAIVEKWPQPQLGRILAKMDEEAVTNLLAALPPPKAIEISKSVADATDEKAKKVQQT